MSYSPDSLAGMRVLVAEDVYYLADHFETIISSAGGEVAGPYDTVAEALGVLRQDASRLSAASLDITLLDGKVFPLADRLAELDVPFVFATGGTPEAIPPRFAHVSIVGKPLSPDNLVDALCSLRRPDRAPAGQPAEGAADTACSACGADHPNS